MGLRWLVPALWLRVEMILAWVYYMVQGLGVRNQRSVICVAGIPAWQAEQPGICG